METLAGNVGCLLIISTSCRKLLGIVRNVQNDSSSMDCTIQILYV
jgi:hypothetical protein